VSRRRLASLVVAVAALLVLAGIASHERPLRGGRGGGPSPTFFDYVATTLVLVAIVVTVVVVVSVASQRFARGGGPRRWSLLQSFAALASGALIAYLLVHGGFIRRLQEFEQNLKLNQAQDSRGARRPPPARQARDPRLRWDEIGVFLALVAGTLVVLYATRTTKRPNPLRRRDPARPVALALDESIDDLRTDPDLRRAIIAAYARMERALAAAGLPRHPAEAPFEYLERALRELDTSGEAVERLTALFEWAKFSHHEPRPEMRDQAIDALVAVRDELARPREPAVTA
jgi:uncharacterized membrane protein YidH (DUF202 family)